MRESPSGRRVVAITGGRGFIGRHLISAHGRVDDEVRVLSRSGQSPAGGESVRVFEGDLTRGSVGLEDFVRNVDILYHCAGEVRDTQAMRALHVDGTSRLLHAATGRIGHWVQLSSVGVYGPRSEGVIDEECDFAPVGEYETTKAEAETLVAELAGIKGFTYSILRPSIVFGPEMPNDSLRQLVRVIQRGPFFFIGRPGANAPYIHVESVSKALLLCGTCPEARNQAFNISENITIEEFVGIIARAVGCPTPKFRVPEIVARLAAKIGKMVPGFPLTGRRVDALTSRAIYDSTKIRRELGFVPDMAVERSLESFVKQLLGKPE